MKRAMKRTLAAGLLLAIAVSALAQTLPPFSSMAPDQALPTPLRFITLPRIAPNKISLVSDEGKTVLRIDSDNSAGSIGIPLTAARAQGNTSLEWRWKVSRMLERADLEKKTGDDYAARVYVFFDMPLESLPFMERSKIKLARMVAGDDVPTAAICYVWDNKHRMGLRAWSPYSNRVRMIVLQSGPDSVGQWKSESRDVAADFREAFGTEMPAVTGVAVGNDTDNTEDKVTTWFGDVGFVGARK